MRDINKKFSVRYYLNLVLVDEEERRYFKQQVRMHSLTCVLGGGVGRGECISIENLNVKIDFHIPEIVQRVIP